MGASFQLDFLTGFLLIFRTISVLSTLSLCDDIITRNDFVELFSLSFTFHFVVGLKVQKKKVPLYSIVESEVSFFKFSLRVIRVGVGLLPISHHLTSEAPLHHET